MTKTQFLKKIRSEKKDINEHIEKEAKMEKKLAKTTERLIFADVDYDYPQCGGIEVWEIDDDTLEVRQYSNMCGTPNGGRSKFIGWYQLREALKKQLDDLDADELTDDELFAARWNDIYTYRDVINYYYGFIPEMGMTMISQSEGTVVV